MMGSVLIATNAFQEEWKEKNNKNLTPFQEEHKIFKNYLKNTTKVLKGRIVQVKEPTGKEWARLIEIQKEKPLFIKEQKEFIANYLYNNSGYDDYEWFCIYNNYEIKHRRPQ